ncbi:hypothetical protein [Sulfuricurvum sp.]|uniref:hypothetical protein n=1 Tax=Sulfuricurvum sp. TaxID=2025608 RepID=UPI0026237251|nr:hypothetical protein [Sulfuricurvum sp.]MDD3597533.1 hypothetical protein [Sulfuricurvum sp.]
MYINKDALPQELQHLEIAKILEMLTKYYEGTVIKTIINDYNLLCSSQKFTKLLPECYDPDVQCKYCKKPMIVKLASRGYKPDGNIRIESKWRCEDCNHIVGNFIRECKCSNCNNVIYDALNENIALSIENMKSEEDMEELDFLTRIYISALLRAGQDEYNQFLIHPKFIGLNKLAPSETFMRKIISSLKMDNWIRFSEQTGLNSFNVENGKLDSYYALKSTFELNLEADEEAISELLNPEIIFTENDYFDAMELWKDIAYYECLEYLYFKMEEYRLPDNIGPKTENIIVEGLKYFSVSQMFNHIWAATKDAAAQSVKREITKKHATNMIAGTLQRRIERSVAEKWDIKPYSRDFNLPQSIIADLLYNRILQIGDKGFTAVPGSCHGAIKFYKMDE